MSSTTVWSGMRCCVSIKPLKLKLSPEAQHIWILCVAVFVPRCLKWFGRVVLWYFTSWVPQCWELCSYQTIKQKKRDYDKTVQIFIVFLMTEVMGNYTKWTQSPKRCFSHWTKTKQTEALKHLAQKWLSYRKIYKPSNRTHCQSLPASS